MIRRKSTIILLVSFFIGLSVLLYPSLSSYWNSKTQSEAIVDYESMLANFKPRTIPPFSQKRMIIMPGCGSWKRPSASIPP